MLIKLIKADGSLIGTYKKLAPLRKRLDAIIAQKGAAFKVRARGTDDVTKYDGSIMDASVLLSTLPTP